MRPENLILKAVVHRFGPTKAQSGVRLINGARFLFEFEGECRSAAIFGLDRNEIGFNESAECMIGIFDKTGLEAKLIAGSRFSIPVCGEVIATGEVVEVQVG